jgi:hypothetical protein
MMASFGIVGICIASMCALPLLFATGIAFFDPLSYTEFFDELQQNLGMNPPPIQVKETLWVHRILLLVVLLSCVCGTAFVAVQGFFAMQ